MKRPRVGQAFIEDGTRDMRWGRGGDWEFAVSYSNAQFSTRDRACENGSNGWPLDMGYPLDTI